MGESSMSESLTKTAVVTGAGSGIGAACARRFIEGGWNVVLNYFGEGLRPAAEAIASEAEAGGVRTILVDGDVTIDADCRRIAAEAAEDLGRIDALINCAGNTRIVPHADLEALTAEDFHSLYAVNTIGPFQMIRACAPHLKATGDAAVVNIASIAGVNGSGSSIAYAASKGALNTLTLSLARVLGPAIRINSICPALVEQGFVHRLDPVRFEQHKAVQVERSPLKRVGQPAEVAETVFWVATGSPLMTGKIIELDCGLHLSTTI
jgi:3-oxoacyl-[acyl-carrier protein] reductase